ncbi:DUF6473 family protein [Thalassococcus sp. BH17M4-6]|uniref:DUF6473 family protein n=1 Tax=Thalassococcus sp. BH17M4-6 TaxID=3413148 RepID=UPI003BDA040E
MTYVGQAKGGLEYYPCRYERSRVLFRGPRRRLSGDYLAFLGGTETYGRFIATPFVALTERQLGLSCVNFGYVNAGLDLYLNDPAVLSIAEGAVGTVIQVMGAQNMSNRYYSVHPRRNDRFLRAARGLQAIYPEVDFTEFHFTRHMLCRLQTLSPERFALVADELRSAWLARMKQVLATLRGPVVLLWFAPEAPATSECNLVEGDPLFLDRSMIEALRPRVSAVVEVTASDRSRAEGTEGMVFTEFEASAAAEQMGIACHEEAAEALAATLADMLSVEV